MSDGTVRHQETIRLASLSASEAEQETAGEMDERTRLVPGAGSR